MSGLELLDQELLRLVSVRAFVSDDFAALLVDPSNSTKDGTSKLKSSRVVLEVLRIS